MRQRYISQGTAETLFWREAICTVLLYSYSYPNISTGFQVFLKACYEEKGSHRGIGLAAAAAGVPVGEGLQVPS